MTKKEISHQPVLAFLPLLPQVIIAKEYMGLERALGTIFYMEGRFPSQDIYLWFSESQDVANETFLSARRYSDLVAALYNKNIEVSS